MVRFPSISKSLGNVRDDHQVYFALHISSKQKEMKPGYVLGDKTHLEHYL